MAGTARAGVIAVDTAGRIVIGGSPPSGGAFLARLAPDGALDPSFGVGGVLVDHTTQGFDAVALQPNGAILTLSQGDLSRYGTGGELDPSFGDGGRTWLGASIGSSGELLTLADGTIVAAGTIGHKLFPSEGVIGGFAPDGSERRWFAAFGLGTPISDVAARADGTLLVSGYGQERASRLAYLVRVDPSALPRFEGSWDSLSLSSDRPGGPDPTFGAGAGFVRFALPGQDPAPYDGGVGALAASGDEALVAGIAGRRLVLGRFTAAGELDTSYGSGGFATRGRRLSTPAEVTAIERAEDGTLFVLGDDRGPLVGPPHPCPRCTRIPFVARFRPDGTIASGFGEAGIARIPAFGPKRGVRATDLVLAPRGGVLFAGERDPYSFGDTPLVPLARLRADGGVARGFGEGGVLMFDPCRGRAALLRKRGCIGKARGDVSLWRSPHGVGLRLRAEAAFDWAKIGDMRVELPPSLALAPGGLKRARFHYLDRREEHQTQRVKLIDGSLRAWHGYLGSSPHVLLCMPAGSPRRKAGSGTAPPRFRVRVHFDGPIWWPRNNQILTLRPGS